MNDAIEHDFRDAFRKKENREVEKFTVAIGFEVTASEA